MQAGIHRKVSVACIFYYFFPLEMYLLKLQCGQVLYKIEAVNFERNQAEVFKIPLDKIKLYSIGG